MDTDRNFARSKRKQVARDLASSSDVLTVREVAKVLRLHKDSVYTAIHRGQIPHVKIGRSLRVPKAGLMRFLGAESLARRNAADATTLAAQSGGRYARATTRQ